MDSSWTAPLSRRDWTAWIAADSSEPAGRFAAAVRVLLAAEGGGDVGGTIVATHGARNAITHALAGLDPAVAVSCSRSHPDAATAILRSGHRPVAVGGDAMVVAAPAPSGTWARLIDLAPHRLVVLDDSRGFRAPRPLAAFVAAGGVVVGSLRVRFGAPGLRVGWLIARGPVAAVAAESVECESRGVAPLLLEVARCAIEAAVAGGWPATHESVD